MDTSMIGKIQKAKEYAQEPERVTFNSFQAEFRGNNDTYTVTLTPEGWECTCPGYSKYRICPHIMTLEKVFAPMLKRERLPYAQGQNVISDVEKSNQYAEELDRITIISFDASFQGGHNIHQVTYDNGKWDSPSSYFRTHGLCSHTIAMEKMLGAMVKPVTHLTVEDSE
jgi:hypothetical protein